MTSVGDFAADFVSSVRAGDWPRAGIVERQLAEARLDQLVDGLPTQHDRLAFWLNLYNGGVRRALVADPAQLRRRFRFFRRPILSLAGTGLSPDDIEHGLLRRGRWRIGLGYLANPLPPRFQRALRVERVDPRIHFALNCGARSCPPLATYVAAGVGAQLDAAARAYLAAEVRLDGRSIVVPRLFLWYLGDFGGLRGVRDILARYWRGSVDAGARLRFGPYDWTPALDREDVP